MKRKTTRKLVVIMLAALTLGIPAAAAALTIIF